MKTTLRRLVGGILICLSLAMLLWGIWPLADQSRQVTITPDEMRLVLPAETAPGERSPAVLEQRLLFVYHPEQIRIGDVATVWLALEMDGQDQLAVPAQAANAPDVFVTHRVIAEARLEMAGMEYRPEGELSEALLPGKAVRFLWSVRGAQAGTYLGTLWLHLRYIPLAGGEEARNVLSAQRVKIEVLSLLGLSGAQARLWGGLGLILGCLLGLDGVAVRLLRKIR